MARPRSGRAVPRWQAVHVPLFQNLTVDVVKVAPHERERVIVGVPVSLKMKVTEAVVDAKIIPLERVQGCMVKEIVDFTGTRAGLRRKGNCGYFLATVALGAIDQASSIECAVCQCAFRALASCVLVWRALRSLLLRVRSSWGSVSWRKNTFCLTQESVPQRTMWITDARCHRCGEAVAANSVLIVVVAACCEPM